MLVVDSVRRLVSASVFLCGLMVVSVSAQQPETITFADGAYSLEIPTAWVAQPPRSPIIQYEFKIPADDGPDGRVTMMGAGGSIKANLDRWIGQFEGGEHTVKVEEVADSKVHQLDATGVFQDRPRGPFNPPVPRDGYRMLAAIIETPNHGNFFVKVYGPSSLIEGAEPAFAELIQSLQHVK
ncbi:MAG: hypothetical protein AAGF97_07325 [Planctomycetota bacterium]